MNTNNENGNSQIPDVPELVLEDGLTSDQITEKVTEHNQAVADYKTKLGEANSSLYARTKKAEGFVQDKEGKWYKPEANNNQNNNNANTSKNSDNDTLSQADLMTIVRSDIPQDDIADVVEYAKFKNISVAEALKSPVVKATLAEKKEARDVAEGTSTGAQRRGSGKISDEALLDNAQKGNLPESPEDMARLAELRRKGGKK